MKARFLSILGALTDIFPLGPTTLLLLPQEVIRRRVAEPTRRNAARFKRVPLYIVDNTQVVECSPIIPKASSTALWPKNAVYDRVPITSITNQPMPDNFLVRLQKGPVLCDGAMGTLLLSKGIFIDRCYDELNVSQPSLIQGIHLEYLQAGADVIETNTFGANSFRLAKHGCADKLAEINRRGARLARKAAKSFDAFVAGAVGPLGIRIEPLGKIALTEAREAFREQIAALNEEGVDLIILETFGYLEELH